MSVRPAVAQSLCSHWTHIRDFLAADFCFCSSEIVQLHALALKPYVSLMWQHGMKDSIKDDSFCLAGEMR